MTTDKVVDASVLAALVFVEPQAEQAGALLKGATLIAPSLLYFELAHVCVKKIRSRPAEAETVLRQFEDAMAIPIQTVDVDHAECVAVARAFNLSACDACYLWLARKLDFELVTFDSNLLKAMAKS